MAADTNTISQVVEWSIGNARHLTTTTCDKKTHLVFRWSSGGAAHVWYTCPNKHSCLTAVHIRVTWQLIPVVTCDCPMLKWSSGCVDTRLQLGNLRMLVTFTCYKKRFGSNVTTNALAMCFRWSSGRVARVWYTCPSKHSC